MSRYILTHLGFGPDKDELLARLSQDNGVEVLRSFGNVIVVEGAWKKVREVSGNIEGWKLRANRRTPSPVYGAARKAVRNIS